MLQSSRLVALKIPSHGLRVLNSCLKKNSKFTELTTKTTRAYTTHSQLPEEHQMVYDMCRKFADDEIAPNASKWDKNHEFPQEVISQLFELGLMGINVSADHGGSGLDSLAYAIATEEISRGCASSGAIMSVHNSLYLYPIDEFGTPEQKERFLAPYVALPEDDPKKN